MTPVAESAERIDDEREAANPAPERPKQKDAVLGDEVVVIKRLGTRDGLVVAQQLLRYIDRLREPLLAAYRHFEGLQGVEGEEEGADRTGDYMEIATEMLQAIMAVLEDDDLLKVLSRLLGQPLDVVGNAPLEDTMNAVAVALSINDVPAFMRAASSIWEEAQKMGARL